MLFFLALICYITSLVGCLFLFIISKNISKIFISALAILHGVFFILTLVYLSIRTFNPELPMVFPLSFLFYCCTGLILFGAMVTSKNRIFFKLYFGIFMLTIPVFLIKPSGLVHMLLNMEFAPAENDTFVIKDHALLIRQQTTTGNTAGSLYKFAMKRGFFTQTIKRDIRTEKPLDSIHTKSYNFPGTVILTGFFQNENGKTDSAEIIFQTLKK